MKRPNLVALVALAVFAACKESTAPRWAVELFLVAQPSTTAQNGVPLAVQPSVRVRFSGGVLDGLEGATVTATTTATGVTVLNGTATFDASGVATFTNLTLTGPSGPVTLHFTLGRLTPADAETITLTAGPPSQLAITTQPAAAANAGVVFTRQPVIQLLDVTGNAASQSGVVVTAAIATGGGTLGGTLTATTNASGVATFTNLQITGTIGSRTLTFSAPSLTSATSGAITLAAGAPATLVMYTQPSTGAQSGAAFAQQPAIQLQDAYGNVAGQNGVVVTAAIATGGGTLGGTATATTSTLGVATFTNLSITGTTGSRTLAFSAPSLTGVTSVAIVLAAGAASQLSITTQPSTSAQSGVAFAQQPAVQLLDGAGNIVSVAGTVVTAAIASGGGTLGGTATATTNASGVATFSDLAISGTVGSRTLSFSATGLTGATSGAIALAAGAASQLSITTQPSATAQSGVALGQQPAVQLLDGAGNIVSASGTVVTAAIASGGGTLGGTTTATTNASGLATFTNLEINGVTGSRTLSFSATGLTGATSGAIAVTGGVASQLSITTQPSTTALSGVAFAQQPVIQLLDANNNPTGPAGIVVTAAISSGGGTLGGTVTATTDAGGLATFTNLQINGTIGARTLVFSSPSLTSATSGAITLSAGSASQMSITTQPSASAQSGVAFAQQPVIQLLDADGNVAGVAGTVVTAAIASGGGTLGGTVTATSDAGGVATFTNLQISGTVGARTLSFSATGLTGATSGTITLAAGPAAVIAVNAGNAQSATVATAVTTAPSVIVRDASTNPVSGVSVTFAVASGGGAVVPTSAVTTGANGIAAATSWTLGSAAGANTLTATSGSLSGSPLTFTATGTAGNATQLVLTTSAAGAASGQAFATQPVVAVRDAQGNTRLTDNTTVVTMTVSAGATVVGTATKTAVSGVAAFSGVGISGVAGTPYTLTFSSVPVLTAATQQITPVSGAGTQLALTTQAAGAANGAAFTTQPVVAVRDGVGNTVTSDNSTVVTMTVSAGATIVGTATKTAVNGVAAFSTVGITGTAGVGYTLTFASGALASATQSITAGLGAATQLILTTQAAGAPSGSAFTTQPVVAVRDVGGNTVTTDNSTLVTMTVSSGATVVGTATKTAVAGVAAFSTVGISGTAGTAYTLTFASGTLTSATQQITPTAGAATQIVLTTAAAGAASGQAFTTQPVVAIRDAAGNTVTTDNSTVVTVGVSVGATLVGTITKTAVNGVAAFANVGISGTAGTVYTMSYSSGVLTSAGQNITPTAGTATQLILTTPAATAPSGSAFGTQPVVAVRDAAGNTVTTDNSTVVTMAVSVGATTVGTVTKTAVNGVATFSGVGISGTAGTAYTLTYSSGALAPATQQITPTAGSATQLALTTSAAGAASGQPFATQPVVAVKDAAGNTVTGDNTTVVTMTVSLGATVVGTATKTAVSGVAIFSGVGISGTSGTAYTLTFSSVPVLTQVTQQITPAAGTATKLGLSIAAAGAASGAAFATQPVVLVQDAAGNTVTGDNSTVVAMTVSAGASTVGIVSKTAVAGVAAFSTAGISGTAGTTYTLSFGSGALTAATQTIVPSVGAATQLVLTTPAAGAPSGVAFTTQPVVAVRDGAGNTETGDNTTLVTMTVSLGATVVGTATKTAVAGVAAFSTVGINGTAGTAYTLTFAGGSLTSATQSITPTVGPATQLGLATSAAVAPSGSPFTTQPVVAIRDGGGNTVTTDNSTVVTMAVSAGATTVGTVTKTAVNGLATFSGVGISGVAGTAYTLTFTSAPVFTQVTQQITVTPGTATHLTLTTLAVTAGSGAPFATQPVVAIRDAANNTETGDGTSTVTMSVSAGATVVGTVTKTVVAGVATFTNVGINGTAGTAYTLTFSSGALTAATQSITPTVGAATQLALTQAAAGAASGVAFTTQPKVAIRDGGGNTVTTDNTTVVTMAVSAGATTVGTVTATAVSGVASFATVGISGTAGTAYTLTFTSVPVFTQATQQITPTAGPAAKLAFTTQPAASTVAGATMANVVVTVQDAGGNTVTTDNTTSVTLAFGANPRGGSLSGTLTRTAASGIATFNNLIIAKTSAGYTLAATSSPVHTGATSTAFKIVLPTGKYMYIANYGVDALHPGGAPVAVLNSATNTVIDTIVMSDTAGTWGVGMTPDGKTAFVSQGRTGKVMVIETATGSITDSVAAGGVPLGVSVDPAGSSAFVAQFGTGATLTGDSIFQINTTSHAVTSLLTGRFRHPNQLVARRDQVWIANDNGTVVRYERGSGDFSNAVDSLSIVAFGPSSRNGIAVDPADFRHIWVASYGDGTTAGTGTVEAIDTTNNSVSAPITVGLGPLGIAITGGNAYVANYKDGTVTVINTTTHAVVTTLTVGTNPIGVAASSDGTKVYVSNTGVSNSSPGTVTVISTSGTPSVLTTVSTGIAISPHQMGAFSQ